MPFEILVAGAELAEVGWNAYQHRQEHNHIVEHEDAATDRELAYIKHENARLQATVEEYKKALEELQGHTESTERLKHALSTQEGTLGVYEQIQKRVDSPEFLEKLVRSSNAKAESSKSTIVTTKDGVSVKVDVNDPSWWEWVTDRDKYGGEPKEDLEHSLGGEGYVIVDQDDVIDGIADFVAHYLVTLPQTEGLPPKELQQLLSQAFTELRKKNSYRRLWDWGRFLYNTACWATTAFGIYRNPVVVRACVVGIWTSSRIILGLFR